MSFKGKVGRVQSAISAFLNFKMNPRKDHWVLAAYSDFLTTIQPDFVDIILYYKL